MNEINYSQFSIDDAADALSYIPSDDRDTWIRMGMALKSEFNELGFATWDAWSRTSSKYNQRVAKGQWRSFRPHSVTIGSLIAEARQRGYRYVYDMTKPVDRAAYRDRIARQKSESEAQAKKEREFQIQRANRAAVIAQDFMKTLRSAHHAYLDSKGLKSETGLVDPKSGDLFIPFWKLKPGGKPVIAGAQRITVEGGKKFWPVGCMTGGCYHAIGYHTRPEGIWFCEGLADGITIWNALLRNFRGRDLVVVCFSAMGMKAACAEFRKYMPYLFDGGDAYVMADGDAPGRTAAKQLGIPAWYPTSATDDPNSFGVEKMEFATFAMVQYAHANTCEDGIERRAFVKRAGEGVVSIPDAKGKHLNGDL